MSKNPAICSYWVCKQFGYCVKDGPPDIQRDELTLINAALLSCTGERIRFRILWARDLNSVPFGTYSVPIERIITPSPMGLFDTLRGIKMYPYEP